MLLCCTKLKWVLVISSLKVGEDSWERQRCENEVLLFDRKVTAYRLHFKRHTISGP